MTDRTFAESFKAGADNVMAKLSALIREGNVRRVVVQQEGRTVAEFPLTAGVVGALLAPVLAAIGALVAVLQDCTIHVERVAPADQTRPADQPGAADESSTSSSAAS